MATQLHTDLEAASSGKPAAYIQTSVLAPMTHERLIESVKHLEGVLINAGNQKLSATLESVVWTPSQSTIGLMPLSAIPSEM